MIYLHETHEVVGGKMAAFDDALRAQWQPLIESDGEARLLWHWHHTHGTGPSYQAITITAVRDWAAWGRIVAKMRDSADWRSWLQTSWTLRREVVSKLMQPAPWSPLREVDLSAPRQEATDSQLYLHDTGWPYVGKLDEYVAALGSIFYPATRNYRMIRVEACWTTCPGSGRHHEVLLLQKILDWPAFSRLLTEGERPSQPGDWMQEGLKYRDRWESKLLRPVPGGGS